MGPGIEYELLPGPSRIRVGSGSRGGARPERELPDPVASGPGTRQIDQEDQVSIPLHPAELGPGNLRERKGRLRPHGEDRTAEDGVNSPDRGRVGTEIGDERHRTVGTQRLGLEGIATAPEQEGDRGGQRTRSEEDAGGWAPHRQPPPPRHR